jgi:aminoglycoside phosphotransferase (APT) family kinase protein
MSKAAPTDLPVEKLGAWLEQAVGDFRGLHTARKFAGGQSNPTFLLEADSGRYVLRRKPPGALLPRRTRWTASIACCARWHPPMCRCRVRSRCATTTP